ncbi:Phosphoserine phosphatase RsbP [compost metagenome]
MLHQVCYPVGLFDTIEVQQKSFNYDGDSHIALYTDGLMEIVAGDYEAQMTYLISYFEGNHEWDEATMQQAFFDSELQQERDDDKCLVWISLKEGGSPE